MRLRDQFSFRQKPTGLFKWILHVPVYLFKLGLGFLMGDRFVLLTHEGRKSGRTYQTPLEVVQHDEVSGEYIVSSGTGPNADWYRNIAAKPATRIQVRNESWVPTQRLLDYTEAASRFKRYEQEHPKTAFRLLQSMGNSYDGTDEGRREMMADMPMVAFSALDTMP
jgi:deazaflavin-dependent oxidoreductase (nitroreductase family)